MPGTRGFFTQGLAASAFLALAAVFFPLAVDAAQEIVTLETRPGVTLKVLLRYPNPPAPQASLILFPGGQGAGHFSERAGQIRVGGNFLTRSSPLVVERGLAAVIVDAPSDQSGGMSDKFRTGKEHVRTSERSSILWGGNGPVPSSWSGRAAGPCRSVTWPLRSSIRGSAGSC